MHKATFAGPGQALSMVTTTIPEVPAEGALIRTTYSGICHSDVYMREDKIDMGDGLVHSFMKVVGDRYLGTTFGHEISGVIVDIGEKVDRESHDLKVGDEVVVYPWIGCQECGVCKIGHNNICELPHGPKDIGLNPDLSGGYANYVPVPQCRFLIKIPNNMPASVACLLPCSGATAYSSLLKVAPQVKRTIAARGQANLLVIGAGGLGLWCIQLAKQALFPDNQVKVFVADIAEDKVEIAIAAGADEGFIWGRDEAVPDVVRKVIKGGTRKMDVVIDFVGSAKTSDIGLKCLHRGGILVVIGLAGGSLPMRLAMLAMRSLTVMGSKTATLHELRDLVQIVSKLNIGYENLQFVQLNQLNEVLDELKAGTVKGRKVIKFD